MDIYNFIEIASHIDNHGSTGNKNTLFEETSDNESTYSNENKDATHNSQEEDDSSQVVIMPDVQFADNNNAATDQASSAQRWGKLFVNIRVHLKPSAIAVSIR